MRIRRFFANAAAVATVALSMSACGVDESNLGEISNDELPARLREDYSPNTSEAQLDESQAPTFVRLYWVMGKQLYPQVVVMAESNGAEEVAAFLERSPVPTEPKVRTAITSEEVIGDVFVDGDAAVVQLSDAFYDIAESDQVLAIGQVVMSLTGLEEIAEVDVRIDGEVVDTPTASGKLVRRPLRASDYESLVVKEQ